MNLLSSKKRFFIVIAIGLCVVLAAVMYLSMSHEVNEPTVLFVTSSEAHEKISEHQDAFILDVRSSGEFTASRVPGAVNIPYLNIEREQNLLPQDRNALIFVYCRTGRRAAIAASELLDLGYVNIVVFPGMATWDYETVSG